MHNPRAGSGPRRRFIRPSEQVKTHKKLLHSTTYSLFSYSSAYNFFLRPSSALKTVPCGPWPKKVVLLCTSRFKRAWSDAYTVTITIDVKNVFYVFYYFYKKRIFNGFLLFERFFIL